MTDKLTSPRVVRDTLAALGAEPSKALGQNFLIDANIVEILLRTAEVTPADTVLEIGPGLGVLTDALAEHAGAVVAVEKDRTFVAHLQKRYADHPRVTVIGGDFLELDIPALLQTHKIGKVVANLPYNSGTRMIVELMRAPQPPRTMVVTVQLEVGERLAAVPGDEGYGMLSVWAGVGYQVELRKKISPSCFYPTPGVWSVVTRLSARDPDQPVRPAAPLFYALTKQAFQHRRKQLAGILDRAPDALRLPPPVTAGLLAALGADVRARPEQLSVAQWLELTARLAALKAE
jgi:16S rRNA (adenine1518-N6/adenine1519-N6)-dimethyltransferase